MTQTRKWTLGTALVVVLVLLAGWYLLVSPRRSEATDLRAQQQEQEAANAQLVSKLQMLKAQSKDLPKQQAKLAAMRVRLPENPQLPGLIRSLTDAAQRADAELVSLAPGVPAPVSIATPAAPAASATATPSPGATPAPTSAATTTGAPATVAPGLYLVPVDLQINGSYIALERFVNKLEELKRSFLVTGFAITRPEDQASAASGAAGAPVEARKGPIDMTINGRVFVSKGVAPLVAAAAGAAATSTTPAPSATPAS